MESNGAVIRTGEATGFLPARENKGKPITVIGTEKICGGFDKICIEQALNSRSAPGVTDLVLNPDAHAGYGAPVGCVLVSPTHIYPGPIGVDIKCSMSLLQLDLPESEFKDKTLRRAVIKAIAERTPTGAGRGQRSVPKGRRVPSEIGRKVATEGASEEVCAALGIPYAWTTRCEDAYHRGYDGSIDTLRTRLEELIVTRTIRNFDEKMQQLGSYGGGNHFGEANVVQLSEEFVGSKVAEVFGLKDRCISFLSHCGSRGFGNILAQNQFRVLQDKFLKWSIPFPADDKQLVYAPLGSEEANTYLNDMAMGGNFATVNHLLINALVLEAFQEVVPGVSGSLVYFISHNIARSEVVENRLTWVHRKGATRAFPAGHFELKDTPFADTGHPILLPGNPRGGSAVMVADIEAYKSCFSVNHGAGRAMGRRAAMRTLNQQSVDRELEENDILTNCRQYPLDEAPDAYKDFDEVLRSVQLAKLAKKVAALKATFVIKDQDVQDD